MGKELICDLLAKIHGFEKVDTTENSGSSKCLVKSFLKNKPKACEGICLKCKSKVSKGKFSDDSEGSTTKNSTEDIWHT